VCFSTILVVDQSSTIASTNQLVDNIHWMSAMAWPDGEAYPHFIGGKFSNFKDCSTLIWCSTGLFFPISLCNDVQ